MRPRRFRRGKPRRSRHEGAGSGRFNEAPAIPPGKTVQYVEVKAPRPPGFNEAPAIPPGKTSAAPNGPPPRSSASMRPRRFRRGKRPRPRTAGQDRDRASMRPRRFRRGKQVIIAICARRENCFNEAPAIPPGKTGPASRCGSRMKHRFNEAPAIPPKTRGPAGRRLRLFGASMRPRRFRRGKPDRRSGTAAPSPTCFNEAPAIPPGKTSAWPTTWPRGSAGFNEAPAIPPGKTGRQIIRRRQIRSHASMRPRRFRRGKRCRAPRSRRRPRLASMRPRRFRRGKRRLRPAGAAPPPGFNEAPAIPPGKTGDGGDAAGGDRSRFNEAPAIPPGKTNSRPDLPMASCRLQ